ncbi:S-adenosyl-L-methionine-dependent methyltransferase [Baffinella frigidus]|nr:S-adenosyl-L-methionine-dependent methyltransferase [Cryptophyta sp. CCMP2293]
MTSFTFVAPLAFVEEFLVNKGEKRKAFALDKDLFDVLLDKDLFDVQVWIQVFPARTDLHDNALVVSGELRLQDKASCLCAHVLSGGGTIPLRVALDPCAAPGGKTTHLSAMMRGEGRLVAMELDTKRAEMLRGTVKSLGATNVEVRQGDFLRANTQEGPFKDVEGIMLDPNCSGSGMRGREKGVCGGDGLSPWLHTAEGPFKDVEGIMLDPSCSGSGMRGREKGGGGGDGGDNDARLQSLAAFQKKALTHALSFPSVKRVV